MKVAVYTLGCKVNQYESNAIAQNFIKNGHDIVDFEEKSDVYIINTCSVTNMSDKKSRQIIRRAKQINSEAIIIATGCYAQVAKKELEKIPEIDLIIGNDEKGDILKILEEYIKSNSIKEYVSDIGKTREFLDFGTTTYTEKTRAVIKVEDGCNNFCTYCIIPYAKGRVRSRKPESVIEEITEIAKQGVKEVVITGIHVASYGTDLNGILLIDLLEKINEIDGIERIRLGSLEPTIITEEFVERLKKLNKICNHFHLSLQSGCNETLKRMNRKYSTEEFKDSVQLLRKNFEDVSLTTDIIVGFPGETDGEFETTYNFLKKIKFTKMHVFKYSVRAGTVAAKMNEQIEPNIKEKRSNKLIKLSDKNEKEFLEKFLNKQVDVLFEKKDGEYYKGHTTNYVVAKVKGNNLENTIKKIKISEVGELELKGIM